MISRGKLNQTALIYDKSKKVDDAEQERLRSLEQLRLVARGDKEAFAELYNRFNLPIFNYMYHMVYDSSIAEELLQEVFLAVWKGASKFRGDASVKTWIYRIAHHQAVSWLRMYGKHKSALKEERLVDEMTPEQKFMEADNKEQILIGLNQLSTDHRAVMELAFFHEFSYQEIAVVLKCPVGTVKSRISYARKNLAKIYKLMGLSRIER